MKKCSKCGFDNNPVGSKFCAKCGEKLIDRNDLYLGILFAAYCIVSICFILGDCFFPSIFGDDYPWNKSTFDFIVIIIATPILLFLAVIFGIFAHINLYSYFKDE